MTGFESKRQAAKAKLDDDDDTQVYADMLLIVYQRGFADGKRAAERKPLTDDELEQIFRKSSGYGGDDFQAFARAIEAAHNIKEMT
jgi:hypothetical protein